MPTELTIEQVADLRLQLLQLVPVADRLTVGASQVREIDLAGVQLLLSFVRTRNARGASTAWEHPSGVLVAALERVGVMHDFQPRNG